MSNNAKVAETMNNYFTSAIKVTNKHKRITNKQIQNGIQIWMIFGVLYKVNKHPNKYLACYIKSTNT